MKTSSNQYEFYMKKSCANFYLTNLKSKIDFDKFWENWSEFDNVRNADLRLFERVFNDEKSSKDIPQHTPNDSWREGGYPTPTPTQVGGGAVGI